MYFIIIFFILSKEVPPNDFLEFTEFFASNTFKTSSVNFGSIFFNSLMLNSLSFFFFLSALYNAKHRIIAARKNNKIVRKLCEFVGPICESTDKFSVIKNFQKLKEKDIIIICDVGAYGTSLSSNYNLRPKPTEILIKNSTIQIINKRQSLNDLI